MIYLCPICNKPIDKFDALVKPLYSHGKHNDANEPYPLFLCECGYSAFIYYSNDEREVYYLQGVTPCSLFNPTRRDKGISNDRLKELYHVEVVRK